MPYYTEIQTEAYGPLTVNCGTEKVAGRLANTQSKVAGDNFSLLLGFDLKLAQPYDRFGSAHCHSANFVHDVSLRLPDYEPLISLALTSINHHAKIEQCLIHTVKRAGATEPELTQHYTLKSGVITDFTHHVGDQHQETSVQTRGHVVLKMQFETLEAQDCVTQTTAIATTTA